VIASSDKKSGLGPEILQRESGRKTARNMRRPYGPQRMWRRLSQNLCGREVLRKMKVSPADHVTSKSQGHTAITAVSRLTNRCKAGKRFFGGGRT